MSNDKVNVSIPPYNLASLIRGLYGRVARQLRVDPSYVSRVARGERQSGMIEASLEKELRRIMSLVKSNHNGANHNGANHNGAGRHAARSSRKNAGSKRKKKVLQ